MFPECYVWKFSYIFLIFELVLKLRRQRCDTREFVMLTQLHKEVFRRGAPVWVDAIAFCWKARSFHSVQDSWGAFADLVWPVGAVIHQPRRNIAWNVGDLSSVSICSQCTSHARLREGVPMLSGFFCCYLVRPSLVSPNSRLYCCLPPGLGSCHFGGTNSP